MKEVQTNFSSKLGIMSECFEANKLSREQSFDEVNKRKLRGMIEKRPSRWMGKKLNENRMLRSNSRTDNRKILYEILHR